MELPTQIQYILAGQEVTILPPACLDIVLPVQYRLLQKRRAPDFPETREILQDPTMGYFL